MKSLAADLLSLKVNFGRLSIWSVSVCHVCTAYYNYMTIKSSDGRCTFINRQLANDRPYANYVANHRVNWFQPKILIKKKKNSNYWIIITRFSYFFKFGTLWLRQCSFGDFPPEYSYFIRIWIPVLFVNSSIKLYLKISYEDRIKYNSSLEVF